MKIICVDNFDREYSSDTLIATGLTPYNAYRIVKFLNSVDSENGPDYYKVVNDSYKLKKFEP